MSVRGSLPLFRPTRRSSDGHKSGGKPPHSKALRAPLRPRHLPPEPPLFLPVAYNGLPMAEQEPQERGGDSQLAFFGEELRREREIRGISLKEIADATKISRRFLEAIERNDHKSLPAPVFTRGFVREYARYVGLNAEDMVNRYNFAAATDDRIEKPPQIEKYPQTPPRDITPRPKPKRGIPPVYARIDRNAVALVFI